MLKRITSLLVALPVAIVLITLAIANRHAVTFVLDPFHPEDPQVSLSLPFYVYLFGMLIAGVVLGGLATWMTQGHWRRAARTRAHEAKRWQSEANRLIRERDSTVQTKPKQLAVAGR